MATSPSLNVVQNHVRAQVCASCAFRARGTGDHRADEPRSCENSCPLFTQLPLLAETARQADPLVGHADRSLARLMVEIGRSGKRGAATVAHNGRKVLKVLENLFQT